jgi:DNA-binding CsgD family transcriptional regulator
MHDFMGPTTRALVLISTGKQRTVNAAVLASRYGLTSAEARLAAILLDGRTLRQAAIELGVQESTLRTRLKVVFHKTRTHRQLDLVMLLRQLADER